MQGAIVGIRIKFAKCPGDLRYNVGAGQLSDAEVFLFAVYARIIYCCHTDVRVERARSIVEEYAGRL